MVILSISFLVCAAQRWYYFYTENIKKYSFIIFAMTHGLKGIIVNQTIYFWNAVDCSLNDSNANCDLTRLHLLHKTKDVMQGKLFEKCTHLLYCSILSLGGNVNTRRMSKPDMGSIFHIKKSMKYSGQRKLLCELSKCNAVNLLGY